MSYPWYYGIHVTKYSTVRERASWVGRITSGVHAVELHVSHSIEARKYLALGQIEI
ncbi:MAG TPA: hypothetical protein VFG77_00685 [Nitrososphaeraceae archaeon]|nr:hypothetical protein [Nitrososphaeraceae archaeon]